MKNKARKLKVISLFSGCGGSDLGIVGGFTFLNNRYEKLPAEVVLALDNDRKAVATYNANFKHKAIVADIKNYDPSTAPDADIVVGGFPCQSFSTVNPTKDPFDERGLLYKEMGKFLEEKKPVAFIAENVKGMARLHKGRILNSILNEFGKHGYKISWQIINAADFGVPQRRERVFIVGTRDDLGIEYKFPNVTHFPIENNKRSKWVGVGAIINSLKDVDKKYYFSERAVLGMKNAKNNMKRGLAQDLKQPSLTVTSHLAKVSLNSRDPVLLVDKNKEVYRRFTPLEAARIQSFPDSFNFIGSEADAYRQIGNAVAPVVMWHITNSLLKQLTVRLNKSRTRSVTKNTTKSTLRLNPSYIGV